MGCPSSSCVGSINSPVLTFQSKPNLAALNSRPRVPGPLILACAPAVLFFAPLIAR